MSTEEGAYQAPEQMIIPNMWLNGTADEAAQFYTEALPYTEVTGKVRYPEEGLPEFQRQFAGTTMTADLSVDDCALMLINGDDSLSLTPAISFMLNFDVLEWGTPERVEQEIRKSWAKLTEGGTVRMELGSYPFARLYGWVEDRFGVNWQLNFLDPDGEARPFLVPQLMFTGAQPRADKAVKYYIKVFKKALAHRLATYRGVVQKNPGVKGALAYTDFVLGSQWLAALDGGDAHDFGFSGGVSLLVQAHGQEEIDALWDGLSAVPEAEQCGWCQDKYGLTWQIVPDNMGELMARPGAYEHMMQMKKLVIADF